MTKKILSDYESTNEKLFQLFSEFKPEHINTVPFEGSWTAAQLAEHLYKSDKLILKTVNGPVKPTERQPDEKVSVIKEVFLDFKTKMKSPDFNTPSNKEHEQKEMLNSLEEKKEEITQVIKTKNLSDTCLSFTLPEMGELTRLEWIYFGIYHMQRHTHQLKNIFEKLEGKK
ncbi:MAG: DinB family protein [Bacteroidota bacterium]|nr:DinB family protein [Bacteroidota bacterium]